MVKVKDDNISVVPVMTYVLEKTGKYGGKKENSLVTSICLFPHFFFITTTINQDRFNLSYLG